MGRPLWVVGVAGWVAAARLRGGLEGVILVGPKAGARGGAKGPLVWVGASGGCMLGANCGTYVTTKKGFLNADKPWPNH